MKSAALLVALGGLTSYGYPFSSSEGVFYSEDKEGEIPNENWNMQQIINNQCRNNKHPLAQGNSLMGDFIIKCLERKVSKESIIKRAREFYSYTKEVVEDKYNEMEKILKRSP